MVMQMLEAGGMPVTGLWPAFEAPQAGVNLNGERISEAWLASIPGHAIKVLDPHKGSIPAGNYRAIWLDRNPEQQARSQLKLLQMFVGGVQSDREMRRRFARSYGRERQAAIGALLAAGVPMTLELSFDNILAAPVPCAHAINEYCGGGLSVDKMAAAVHPRRPECARGMELELGLLSQRVQP
jgi:hypothetical protein